MVWRREWVPSPVFLPGEFHGRRACWATVQGVTKCQEPAWGIPPMAKVMRKEAWHTQRRDQALGDPWTFSSIYPQNQSLPTLLHYAFTYTSDMGGRGLSPTNFLWKGANLELQLINLLGLTRVFQPKKSSDGSLACLTGLSSHMWLFTASQPWEAQDAINFLNIDSFEKLENY